MRKAPLILLGLFIALIAGRFIYGMAVKPSDEQLIQQALKDALDGSKQGRTGSLVDLISSKLAVNGASPGVRQVADFVKKSRPDVKLANSEPVVTGDTAQITSDANVSANFLGTTQSIDLKNVQLVFKKEMGTDWMIFPTTKWRLTDVNVSPDQLPAMSGVPGF